MKHKTTALRHRLMAALLCLIAFTGIKQVNAQCDIASTNFVQNDLYGFGGFFESLGQSFTATCSGVITSIDIQSTDINVSGARSLVIYQGNGGSNPNLIVHNKTYTSTTNNNGFIHFDLDLTNPIITTTGDQFTFFVAGSIGALSIGYTNPYSGGDAYGITQISQIYLYNNDFNFNVHIAPPCTPTSSTFTVTACGS